MLYALDSVNALEKADLLKALSDDHPQVRRHAIRLSESRLDKSPILRDKVLSLVKDADPAIQFQLALSLGECHDRAASQAIASILLHASKNRDISDAALTSIVDRAGMVLSLVLGNDKWAAGPAGESIIGAIVGQIARQRRTEDLDVLVSLLRQADGKKHAVSQAALLKALSRLPSGALKGNDPPQLAQLQELRQSAAKNILAEAVKVLGQSDASWTIASRRLRISRSINSINNAQSWKSCFLRKSRPPFARPFWTLAGSRIRPALPNWCCRNGHSSRRASGLRRSTCCCVAAHGPWL